MHNTVYIVLPKWIWEDSTNNDEFKRNLGKYMKPRYPGYVIVSIDHENKACRCDRG